MTLTTERQHFEEWFHEEIVLNISTSNEAVVRLMWKAWQASRELLANREAQPVGYIDPDSLKEYRGQRAGGTWSAVQRTTSGLNMTTPIYTAPPAPAVPDALEKMRSIVADPRALPRRKEWISGQQYSYVLLENVEAMVDEACRAAMLAQPVSSGYKLPDGWIACSERMPDNDETKPIAIYTGKCLGQGMFVATYDEDGFFDYWEGGEIIGVTHWMPLPAAPESGN